MPSIVKSTGEAEITSLRVSLIGRRQTCEQVITMKHRKCRILG